MYAPFFGLSQDPFSIAPDPRYLFMSERHREALAHLLYGLDGGGGFVLLTGEIGTGKTTVCRCFLEQIPPRCNVAYIFNPKLTVGELLQSVCDEFGIAHGHPGPGAETVKDCIDPLNAFLLRTHAAGEHNVLVIDEAQNLSADVLEQLRLLTNLETNEKKLLQIILIGQPELRSMLARPELEQLAQRVIARFHLDALTQAETEQYIAHRLAVGGRSGALPFDRAALQQIHKRSHGVPRRINLLCGRALLGAYASGRAVVDKHIVTQAASEVFDEATQARKTVGTRQVLTAATGLVLLAGVAFAITRHLPMSSMSATPAVQPASAAASSAVASASAAGVTASALTSAAEASLPELFANMLRDESAAWLALAPSWDAAGDTSGNAEAKTSPCNALARQGLQCFRNARTSLALIRQLDRPGVITLFDSQGKAAYALLTGLDARHATLNIAGAPHQVPLDSLALWWRGDFATLWRSPADQTARGTAAWVQASLAALPGAQASAPATNLYTQTYRFQLAQGLTPDGQAGPLTLMLLNRASGVAEPRLQP